MRFSLRFTDLCLQSGDKIRPDDPYSIFPSATTMASEITIASVDHEAVAFLALEKKPKLHKAMPVLLNTPITRILNRMNNVPAVALKERSVGGRYWGALGNISLKVKGKDAGTVSKPDVEKLLAASKPSPFGKGDKTVMDPDYRNGKEIEAKDFKLGAKIFAAESLPASHLFCGQGPVTAKLYKVAIYEEGGKFDWHRDTTHGDGHHATVLIALNTEWEGGKLSLRHGGQEVSVNMHPKVVKTKAARTNSGEKAQDLDFKIVAFYTDVEHKVEEVKKGVRIVLQYDVILDNPSPVKAKKDGGEDEDGEGDDDEEEEKSDFDEFDEDEETGESPLQMNNNEIDESKLKHLFDSSDDTTNLERLTKLIHNMLTEKGMTEVGFALAHLYRKACIRPEYLKGVDAVVYKHLQKTFDVSLCPVRLTQETNYDGGWDKDSLNARKYPSIYDAENRKVETVKNAGGCGQR